MACLFLLANPLKVIINKFYQIFCIVHLLQTKFSIQSIYLLEKDSPKSLFSKK